MKRIHIFFITVFLLVTGYQSFSQVISESTKRKFTVGADVFTDIWLYDNDRQFMDSVFDPRVMQQGATGFMQYNMQLGKSKLISFAIGLGIRNHNLYTNSLVEDVKADTAVFVSVPSSVSYKKAKINLVYLDLPLELKLKWKNGLKIVPGFKVSYLIDSKQKYKGDRYDEAVMIKEKTKKIEALDKWSYGPTFRIGYKFVTIYAYYQLSGIFEKGRGPVMNPLSLGVTITPF
jgi:hypothetical protein